MTIETDTTLRPWRRRMLRPVGQFTLEAEDAPESIDAGYAAILSEMAQQPGVWAAWKLGGTNHASKAAFAVEEGYFGALHDSEIFVEPASAPHYATAELKGEVEIALRIAADGAGYDAWAVALEMPSSAIANLPDAGVAALVADRCAAGALLLGPMREGPLPDLSSARFTLSRDEEVLGEAGYEALVADPVEILREFMELARRYGFAPVPGQWVSTGGITPCYGFAPGERAVVRLDGAVEIDCRMDSSDRT